MKLRLVEWRMDENLVEAVQYGVVDEWSSLERNHAYGWQLANYEWLQDVNPRVVKKVRTRMNRAIKCYKEAQFGGCLWVKHHFTLLSNPKFWTPRDTSTIVAVTVMPKAKEWVKSIMQERLGRYTAPVGRNIYLGPVQDEREKLARLTLRNMLGHQAYEQYIRKGFVSYTGKSGRHYQVFPGRTHTRVFEHGKDVCSLCAIFSEGPNRFAIILEDTLRGIGVAVGNTEAVERVEIAEAPDEAPGSFCPTDQLIMRLVLLMADESHFESLCNKHPPRDPYARHIGRMATFRTDNRNLNEIYRDIRQLVA